MVIFVAPLYKNFHVNTRSSSHHLHGALHTSRAWKLIERWTRAPRTFGLGRPRFVPELPSVDPSADGNEHEYEATRIERAKRRWALLENLRRPWNSSPGTRHVPDRITGRDGKFPVFPEQLTRRGNTCSYRYRVYIPTRSIPTFLQEGGGEEMRDNHPNDTSRARAAELSCQVLTLSRVALSGSPSACLHCCRQLRAVSPNRD